MSRSRVNNKVLLERVKGSLWGIFIGDALAMPAHWYYNKQQLKKDHGIITTYQPPKLNLQGSILNMSNTGGGGRGSDEGNIIGDVICHGKKKYWLRSFSYFYHCTLQKGENTLEVQITRLLLRHITSSFPLFHNNNHNNHHHHHHNAHNHDDDDEGERREGREGREGEEGSERGGYKFDGGKFREEFKEFMTKPGTHNDSYASTYIRMFFANYVKGYPLDQCPDNDGHNVDTIDGLTSLAPVVYSSLLLPHISPANNTTDDGGVHGDDVRGDVHDDDEDGLERKNIERNASEFLTSLRKTTELQRYGKIYSTMLISLLYRDDALKSAGQAVKEVAISTAREMGLDLPRLVQSKYLHEDPTTACYVESSFPAMLVFLYKYSDDPHGCLVASVNAGGENVARSALVGSILGVAYGPSAWLPWMISDLVDTDRISEEILAFSRLLEDPNHSSA